MSTTLVWAKKLRWAKKIIVRSLVALIPASIIAYLSRAFLLGHKRWVAIVVLSLVVLFLVRLIVAIKRFHERTVNQRVLIASTLSRHVATIEEYVNSQWQQLDQERLEVWLNTVEYSINQCFGPEAAPAALRALYGSSGTRKPVPNDINDQVLWMRRYTGNLNIIINNQHIPITPSRLTRKERKALKQAEESARAWAEEQGPKKLT